MAKEITELVNYKPILQWTKNGVSHQYTLNDYDVVWLARALWKEGAPRAAVGHTLLQRFAALYPQYTTLSKFLRAYCQPLNPHWFPSGYRHKRKVTRLKKLGKNLEAKKEIDRAKRRIEFSQTPWEDIPEQYRDLTLNLLKGLISNPVPKAVHFCMSQAKSGSTHEAAKIAAEQYAVNKGLGPPIPIAGGFGTGMNWFFESKGSGPPKIAMIGQTKITKNLVIASKRRPGEAVAAGILGLALLTSLKKR